MYVGVVGGPDQFYLNNGDETFTNATLQAGIYQPANTFSVNMADINQDGYLDIYVSNFLAENVLLKNNGPLCNKDDSYGTACFDYNQDGFTDIAVANRGPNEHM